MADPVAVTCIRHGLTLKNIKGAYIGWTDVPLSVEGRNRLQGDYPEADLVVSSDLMRCRETAEILYPGRSLSLDADLREMNFGDWEGKTYDMLKSRSVYRQWLDHPLDVAPPNGENYRAFGRRVKKGWMRAVSHFDDPGISHIVIVSHGGPVRMLLEQYGPNPRSFWEWKVDPGHGFTLLGERRQIREGGRCTSLRAVPTTANGDGQKPFIT
jgi:alpha-ribazole phosphatase